MQDNDFPLLNMMLPFLLSLATAASATWAFKTRKPLAVGITVALALATIYVFTRH